MTDRPIINLAFYRFVPIDAPEPLRDRLYDVAADHELKGTVLLANEGINGMLAGTEAGAEGFMAWLGARFHGIEAKRSRSTEVPFGRLVVKLKPEIVTMRVAGVDVADATAPHLPPERLRDWLRAGEDMVLIDTRNDYECQLGTFEGAINPRTEAFHEFPDYVRARRDALKGRKVVMFCTGGIRCEKATSWMLSEGFEDVYQLEGGILNYFERIEDAERDWRGECFVFDGRVAVDTDLEETDTLLCVECGSPACDCAASAHGVPVR